MGTTFPDYVGYSASIFIVLSFLLKDLKKIRVINLIGCILFVAYGVLKGNGDVAKMYWPIIIPNLILSFVQVYHLLKKDN